MIVNHQIFSRYWPFRPLEGTNWWTSLGWIASILIAAGKKLYVQSIVCDAVSHWSFTCPSMELFNLRGHRIMMTLFFFDGRSWWLCYFVTVDKLHSLHSCYFLSTTFAHCYLQREWHLLYEAIYLRIKVVTRIHTTFCVLFVVNICIQIGKKMFILYFQNILFLFYYFNL